MGYITLGQETELQIKIPTKLTTNWADELKEHLFKVLVKHDHSGMNGMGVALSGDSFLENSVSDLAIRLRNNEYLRARNAADTGDINILKVNASDNIEFDASIDSLDVVNNITVGGTLNIPTLSAAPVSATEGDLYIDDGTTNPKGIYTYDGTSWISAPNAITASNQGTGEGTFIQKTGDDLEFKSIVAGDYINISSNSNEIIISQPFTQVIGSEDISSDIPFFGAPQMANVVLGSLPKGIYSVSCLIDISVTGSNAGSTLTYFFLYTGYKYRRIDISSNGIYTIDFSDAVEISNNGDPIRFRFNTYGFGGTATIKSNLSSPNLGHSYFEYRKIRDL